MPSINPTKVPLFVRSICVFIVEAHLLLPSPLSRHRSLPPLTLHARCVEWPIHHVPKNRLQPDTNIVRDRVHPALLAKYSRPWHTLFCVPRPARGFTPQDFGIFHRGCRQDEPNLNSRETLSRVSSLEGQPHRQPLSSVGPRADLGMHAPRPRLYQPFP